MRDRLHKLLSWLLCALLVGAGAPQPGRAQCRAESAAAAVAATMPAKKAPTRSCCVQKSHCCCPTVVADDCGCKLPQRDPPRTPPLQKQPLQVCSQQRLCMPTSAVPPPSPRALPRANVQLPTGALPRCSRQEALSVWRC